MSEFQPEHGEFFTKSGFEHFGSHHFCEGFEFELQLFMVDVGVHQVEFRAFIVFP